MAPTKNIFAATRLPAAVLAIVFAAASAFARGGGGCLQQGTAIYTPSGSVAVETLKPGDKVSVVRSGLVTRGTVSAVTRVEPEQYVEIRTAAATLRLTATHPVQTARGAFLEAGRLRPGDRVFVSGGETTSSATVTSVARIPATMSAYDLLVDEGGIYVAGGVVVHNKGCFVPETPVLLADGTEKSIADVVEGDELAAFASDGSRVKTRVRSVVSRTVEEIAVVRTDKRTIRVTADHPFYVGDGTFKSLEALRSGDTIYECDGSVLVPQRIMGWHGERGSFLVYNLQTDAPYTFFAAGTAVHNKGCFVPDTPVLMADGTSKRIGEMQAGDTVLAFTSTGSVVRAVVSNVTVRTADELVTVRTANRTFEVTPDHPFYTGEGTFKVLDALKPGDIIHETDGLRLVPQAIVSMERRRGSFQVYNLQTDTPHTFFADGVAVHNKGGCFPPDTPVKCANGAERRIEDLTPGSRVLACDDAGRTVVATVRTTYTRVVPTLLTIRLEDGRTVRVTPEHPFAVGAGEFVGASQLDAGDAVLTLADDGVLLLRRIERVTEEDGSFTVHNIEVDGPHTFVAAGCLVHNKGGGSFGGRRSGSRGGSGGKGDDTAGLIAFFVLGTIVVIVIIANRKQARDQNLDYVHPRSAIDRKEQKTVKLLEFIARTDSDFSPEILRKQAKDVFLKLQECWQARDYGPMKPLMMPDLYNNHLAQINGMIRQHEINRMEGLQVLSVDLVNVRYTHKENQREYTVSFIARMKDTYIDDRTGKFVRGDDKPATFQEFWTFQRQGKEWRLRDIEQSRETQVLKEENFFEQFTDQGVEQIYGDSAGKAGPVGPWLEKETADKATRIERMLNFLVQTDKIWDRESMLRRAREVYTRFYMALESGDSSNVADDLFQDTADGLKADLEQKRSNGVTTEFRNFCVRKVELIHVGNYADAARDEFTVRMSAHAQRVVRKGTSVLRQDEDVTPFAEFWTFGRAGGVWKLKEVVPESRGEGLLRAENVDEDSSADQLQWYYKQTRAV